jgi:hypothetical protein
MSERKRKPKRHIAAGLGYLQDVQIGVAGSRAPDLHQDLTRPGFGKRDLTKFARLLSEASEQVSTPLSMSTSSMCRHVCVHIIRERVTTAEDPRDALVVHIDEPQGLDVLRKYLAVGKLNLTPSPRLVGAA